MEERTAQHHFARSLARAKRPVVFLIDDLDRCDEDYVVEFLEVMQTLVRDAPAFLAGSAPRRKRRGSWGAAEVAGPYAFIAADGRWIRSSYEKHYDTFKLSAAPGRPLGYLFQEKIFQLHIRLPSITPTVMEAYLASLLVPQRGGGGVPEEEEVAKATRAKAAVREARSGDELVRAARGAKDIADPVARMEVLGDAAVKFSERTIEDAAEHDLAPFARFLEPNPRSMKLFVNTYGVLRSLRTLEEVFVDTGPLALWTVIEIRWPYLADYLRVHPRAVDDPTNDLVPQDVRSLLAENEVVALMKDARSGPLTPELIRECSGSP